MENKCKPNEFCGSQTYNEMTAILEKHIAEMCPIGKSQETCKIKKPRRRQRKKTSNSKLSKIQLDLNSSIENHSDKELSFTKGLSAINNPIFRFLRTYTSQ